MAFEEHRLINQGGGARSTQRRSFLSCSTHGLELPGQRPERTNEASFLLHRTNLANTTAPRRRGHSLCRATTQGRPIRIG